MIRALISALLTLALLTPSGCQSSGAAGPVAGVLSTLTLGLSLDRVMDQIQQAIENAKNAGLSLEMQAGREVALAISNAKNAYAESLNLTMDRVDQTTRNTVAELQTVANSLLTRTYGKLDQVTAKAQQIVNSLPFRSHQPQLTSVQPSFVVPSTNNYPVTLRFHGNFEYASRKGYTPSFTVNGVSYQPTQNSTQELQFSIPVTAMFDATSSGRYSVATGTLLVPWSKKKLFGRTEYRDSYRVVVGALPSSPGRIRVIHTVKGSKIVTKPLTSNHFYQTSADDGGNDDRKNVPYSVSPETGWSVVKGTSSPIVDIRIGTPVVTFVSDDGDKVQYSVTTIHRVLGTSDQIVFRIKFEQQKTVPDDKTLTEEVPLTWGDSKTFPYPAGSWKVLFDGFDGSHQEFQGPSDDTKFLRVEVQAGSLRLSTVDPRTLTWP